MTKPITRRQMISKTAGTVIGLGLASKGFAMTVTDASMLSGSSNASGIPEAAAVPNPSVVAANASYPFTLGHYRLIQANLIDETDVHSELLQETEWLLHPSGSEFALKGNAFALENTIDGSGIVFLKLAPLPAERATQVDWDLRTHRTGSIELNEVDGYAWVSSPYKGGKWGRIAASHTLQRQLRPYNPARDGQFLTNTWGDGNRDTRINGRFMEGEVDAAAKLGADIVQIDDGWHVGITANSSRGSQGVWTGFWASDPNFWDLDTTRFPGGIAGLVAYGKTKGVKIGLWFAPDSSNEAANWERDADALLRLHHDDGVDFFKVDALKITSQTCEDNFRKFFEKVRTDSKGGITLDTDITAERRFGYFGAVEAGPLFVENRYTDAHSYWPHSTLRSAWQLAHWIDPVRLRIEWLNNTRNTANYTDDPLGPGLYTADTLFAITMFCSPLGWFENQSLPDNYFRDAGPVISQWRLYREEIYRGTILPVGDAPDGLVWTGFVSISPDLTTGYVLLFRELNDSPSYSLTLPLIGSVSGNVQVLGGIGTGTLVDGELDVVVRNPLGYLWLRFVVGG